MVSENETIRRHEQDAFDSTHSQEERNEHGQFATPYDLARAMAEDLQSRVPSDSHVLEPSCGTGSFISALSALSDSFTITGVEKDSSLSETAQRLWANDSCNIVNADFFDYASSESEQFDAIISNPPYSRHHHLSQSEKRFYSQLAVSFSGVSLSGLAGLHAYFLLVGTGMLKTGGIGSWLIPSELFSVNYGEPIRKFLTQKVTLERIHFFDPENLQFDDALVTSCVTVIKREKPGDGARAVFTYGDFRSPRKTISIPLRELAALPKWQHLENYEERENHSGRVLGDYFKAKRGIATGGNSFFIKTRDEWHNEGIADEWLSPILPAPRSFHLSEVTSDASGWPQESDIALLNIPRTASYANLPTPVRKYLDGCPEKIRGSYILRHRSPWYSIGNTKSAPIVCTYMSRSDSTPFRFIRNKSDATITNAYLGLYPQTSMSEEELDSMCNMLNNIPSDVLINGGREYGGGLKKLEPRELMSLPLTSSPS
ncbi:modification methylase [Bifidobacterium thermophilum]|uniref:N-6 DNA methylase n=1 Tax=Bifidobacterium thermophilum TaxID=33905 RepID=UPI000C70E32C|nr:N-6 DNA methylase [Bifidobacterium thermophilum]PKU90114.1 modification methylase [Bifidobacterium thermophilum]